MTDCHAGGDGMTEDEVMNKMRASADEFKALCRKQQYVMAINLYNMVRVVAVYIEMPEDKLTELFGSYGETEEQNIVPGLFPRQIITSVADRAMKQEIEENSRGNPTQVHDFRTYLPRSYFKSRR